MGVGALARIKGLAMYVSRNIEAHSCIHCCSGKAANIKYSACVFVAISIQHAMRMRYCHLLPLRLCNIFSTLSQKRHDF